jgi:hypothetical protein
MHLGRLYLAIAVTGGLYILLWGARLADDWRRHKDPKVDAWHTFAGLALPLVGWMILYRLGGWIEQLRGEADGIAGPRPRVAAGLGIVLIALCQAQFLMLAVDPSVFLINLAVVIAILPLPFLLLQHQLNAIKRALDLPIEDPPTGSVNADQAYYLLLGVFLMGFFLAMQDGLGLETDNRPDGQAVEAGWPVYGTSDLYSLTPVHPSWVRVGDDDIHEGADLSLYGASSDTYVVVYVRCEDMYLDQRVDFRRGEMRKYMDDITMTERRELLTGSGAPVSYADYRGTEKDGGDPGIWAATTVAEEDFLVEVVGTVGDATEFAAMTQLVKSLRLRVGVTSCNES